MVKQNGGSWRIVGYTKVSGTGTYSYTCMNIYGEVQMEARYVSKCALCCGDMKMNAEMNSGISSIGNVVTHHFYREYFSFFGLSSTTINNHFQNYVGYNGNNCIYMANINGLDNGKAIDTNTCDLFGKYIDLKPESAVYNSSSRNINYKSFLVGDESYEEYDSGTNLMVRLNLTDIGAAIGTYNISSNCPRCIPYTSELKTSIKANNQPEAEVCLLPNDADYQIGINVTHNNNKMTMEEYDLEQLMLGGLSLIPVVGIIPSAASFALTAQNLVNYITSTSLQQSNHGNKPATVLYTTCGGQKILNWQERSCSFKNFYSTGLVGGVCISNQYVTEPFTLCISYSSMFTENNAKGATINDILNFTPATLIYNNSIPSSLSGYTLYLIDENTGSAYKLFERNTLFGFFVNPSQNYDLYKFMNGKLSLITEINSKNLISGSEYNVHL
ncbi:hypothetical protein ACNF40_01040 [Cuniculiplasma sp. SKW4]|uniref:hypothetical protein n=1 Tax=Cuniculiplasma sp. SKW4 TaxID=3400171 RepID=UPI003FD21362